VGGGECCCHVDFEIPRKFYAHKVRRREVALSSLERGYSKKRGLNEMCLFVK
jgi:hypothetical protein